MNCINVFAGAGTPSSRQSVGAEPGRGRPGSRKRLFAEGEPFFRGAKKILTCRAEALSAVEGAQADCGHTPALGKDAARARGIMKFADQNPRI